ncbi:PDZ domain-containing protein [Bacillus sp. DX1.1]|uniref:PDZ domain-containing protein n=1 Tax=unclassified Bacillus (in: firmicutes) TaxID=185979 RepID=UPI0025710D83|nr:MULTISPECIES: PDZ domain-containing protein [unclassified Bacillus (in: firmicutes)]MDM5157244.1 PDZ domain-containing protein [Bacillus sp. DX1.1]WJE81473.1 PDZ domain-containing protein [Bacillus sp. DX3.1]
MVVKRFVEAWLFEVIKAVGRFFLHPAVYVFFISSIFVGYLRVLRERKDFSFKVYDVLFEMRTSMFAGIGYGFLVSVITIGAGLVLSQASIWAILIWTLLFGLAAQYRYLSSAYTFGIAIVAAMLSSKLPIPFLQLQDGEERTIPSLAILLGVMLIVEGLLISKNAVRHSTPKLRQGKRGLNIGLHESKRLWLVPIFILVPGDAVTQFVSWWPVVSVGSQTYSLFLVPFLIGFMRTIKSYEPTEALLFTGRRVFGLAALVLILGVASYWWPLLAIVAMGVAMLGRFTISMQERIVDETRPAYFAARNDGLVVLGTIPNTAGAEMNLKPGEVITKVNGVIPMSVEEFYDALQTKTTGAFCKLEVLDTNGELRLVQNALYAGVHYELGIVFVEQEHKWDTEAM